MTIPQALELAQKHHSAGNLQQAAAIYQQILSAQPQNSDALHLLGVIGLQTGRLEDARQLINRAITINPNDLTYLCNLGLVLIGLNRAAEAIAPLQQAVGRNPNLPEAWSNLGYAWRVVGRLDDAIAACRRALALRPDYLEAHFNLATALRESGQLGAAIEHLRRIVSLRPSLFDAVNLLGISLNEAGRLDEAIAVLANALKINPNSAPGLSNLGHFLHEKGEFAQAIELFRRAIALDPNFGECWNNLGSSLRGLNRIEEAVDAYREAVRLRPQVAQIRVDLGVGLQELEKVDEAIGEYEQALRLDPQLVTAHYNLGLALMLKGNLERGFTEYAWREKVKDLQGLFQSFPQARWDGRELGDDERLLIHVEQGLGDTIQFVRYLPMVVQRVKKVILAVQPPLKRLLESIPGIEQLATHGDSLLPFQFHCPLLSLPQVFKTTLATVPADVPYLKVDSDLIAQWRQRIGDEKRLKIGLAWAGARAQKNNRNRSIPPNQLGPLIQKRDDVRWFSLQKDQSPPYGMDASMSDNITDWTAELNDFADTAALLENLDLLITADTSVAHLAGALGKPVWVFMAMAPDFRWLLKRSDSPWYPTMRLFRQSKLGDWTGPIDNVMSELQSFRKDER